MKFLQKIDKIKSSVITQAQRFQPDNRYSQSLQFCTHFAHHLAHTGPQHTPLIFFTSSHLDKETKFRVSDQDHIGPGLRFGWYKNSLAGTRHYRHIWWRGAALSLSLAPLSFFFCGRAVQGRVVVVVDPSPPSRGAEPRLLELRLPRMRSGCPVSRTRVCACARH